jgi:hypothetical protein
MKKLFAVMFVAGALSIVSCGPNAEEKAKQEADAKAKMDSLFNAAATPAATTDSAAATTAAPVEAAPATTTTEEKK